MGAPERLVRQNQPDRATHAGGVVYKFDGGAVEYLLVRPRRPADEWVLPKGHIEAGESDEETALREVEEETGVVARMIAPLEMIEFDAKGEVVRAKFFLLEFVRQGLAKETRETRWTSFGEALALFSHEQSRKLLSLAEASRPKNLAT